MESLEVNTDKKLEKLSLESSLYQPLCKIKDLIAVFKDVFSKPELQNYFSLEFLGSENFETVVNKNSDIYTIKDLDIALEYLNSILNNTADLEENVVYIAWKDQIDTFKKVYEGFYKDSDFLILKPTAGSPCFKNKHYEKILAYILSVKEKENIVNGLDLGNLITAVNSPTLISKNDYISATKKEIELDKEVKLVLKNLLDVNDCFSKEYQELKNEFRTSMSKLISYLADGKIEVVNWKTWFSLIELDVVSKEPKNVIRKAYHNAVLTSKNLPDKSFSKTLYTLTGVISFCSSLVLFNYAPINVLLCTGVSTQLVKELFNSKNKQQIDQAKIEQEIKRYGEFPVRYVKSK